MRDRGTMQRPNFGALVRRIFAMVVTTALVLVTNLSVALAATYTAGSLSLSTPAINATSVTYTLTLSGVTTSAIKCIQVQFTTAVGSTAKPSGMNVGSTTFSGTSNYVPTPASWTVTNDNTNGIVQLTDAGGETPASASSRTIVLAGITNGSTAGTTYYAEVSTYNNTNCSSSGVDSGNVAFAFSQGVTVTATVNPTLAFTISSTSCALGTLSISAASSCSHTMTAGTNAVSGYTVSYLAGNTLTSAGAGSPTIDAIGATKAASATGTEQFGINLKANATPSVGADPSGGSGAAAANYDTADRFAFSTSGASIATASSTSANTTYTVSYIANIASDTDQGAYSTTVTYNIVANY